MEWLKKLIEKHTKDGKLDTEAFMDEVKTEFPKNAVPKGTYNELAEAKKKLEKDIQERDGQLEELKKTAGASEDLKKQIEQLQAENKKKDEEYQTQLKDITLTNAIKLAIAGKVHDEEITASLFDKSKLVIDGDKVVGLEEQLKSLQESKAFLFKPAEEGEAGKTGFQPKVGSNGKGTGTATDDQLAAIFGNKAEK
jgi:seryl-tRNA synthetase